VEFVITVEIYEYKPVSIRITNKYQPNKPGRKLLTHKRLRKQLKKRQDYISKVEEHRSLCHQSGPEVIVQIKLVFGACHCYGVGI
jgi:hypothetical protein